MEPGVLERLRLVCIGAVAVAGCALLIAAVLWMLGALDDVQWNEDVLVGVAAAALLYVSLAVGFVAGRWWTVLAIWAIAVAVIAMQQLQWHDDPAVSGIDDLPPSYGLRFTPLVMVLPTIGVVTQRWLAGRRTPSRSPRTTTSRRSVRRPNRH